MDMKISCRLYFTEVNLLKFCTDCISLTQSIQKRQKLQGKYSDEPSKF